MSNHNSLFAGLSLQLSMYIQHNLLVMWCNMLTYCRHLVSSHPVILSHSVSWGFLSEYRHCCICFFLEDPIVVVFSSSKKKDQRVVCCLLWLVIALINPSTLSEKITGSLWPLSLMSLRWKMSQSQWSPQVNPGVATEWWMVIWN